MKMQFTFVTLPSPLPPAMDSAIQPFPKNVIINNYQINTNLSATTKGHVLVSIIKQKKWNLHDAL